MIVTTNDQLEAFRDCGKAVAKAIRKMGEALEPGMTAKELDDLGRAFLESEGAQSAPEQVYDFPGATCISIEPVVAHGWADARAMKAGDLVNIDVSACKNGYFTDAGATFILPPVTPEKRQLVEAAKRARDRAVAAIRSGASMQVIPQAFAEIAREGGYSIIENLLGCHGVGETLHDKPEILAIPDKRDKRKLAEGMVLAIEPFLSTGAEFAHDGDREWELFTPGCLTAQFEHTVIVSKKGPIIVTL
ncbi:type I methionyl aminopeptidase [uncultured Cohaesibacter sp.]|uniref:type I methionyl aminopeptidase n=1 Tax=uncultured Cohaesibacter sp. TaxID=1002546 RepID=UPI0029C6831C|nr:type I methionyl aminopeptidase [uncultured Cohaesibacter sp.]